MGAASRAPSRAAADVHRSHDNINFWRCVHRAISRTLSNSSTFPRSEFDTRSRHCARVAHCLRSTAGFIVIITIKYKHISTHIYKYIYIHKHISLEQSSGGKVIFPGSRVPGKCSRGTAACTPNQTVSRISPSVPLGFTAYSSPRPSI